MRRIQLYTFLLVSIFVVSACSEAVIAPTEEGHSIASSTKTTFITIDESTAGAEMPTRAALPSDDATEGTRAAVTMDENFNLLGNDPQEFETDAYIIKEDNDMNDNGKRHIAYVKILWKQVKKVNGGFQLSTYYPKIELEWPNNNPIPIENERDGSSKWYIGGIIGGTMERVFNDSVPLSVEFYKDTKKLNEHVSIKGKNYRKFNIPFVAEWKKLEIKGKNKIAFSGLQFKPQGVVFHIKIKRNDKLITNPDDYRYMFASTALTGNIFYAFNDMDLPNQNNPAHILNAQKKFNPVANNWQWYFPKDERNLGGRENGSDKEMAYQCKLEGEHKKGVDYDEFWVWGMPIEHGMREFNGDGYMEHNTSITSYHGGFALGWTDSNFKTVKRGEFLVANNSYGQITDEWNQPIVDWSKYMGKVINVNLKVKRPGSKKYKWCIPLERFAKSNLNATNPSGFTNDLSSGTGKGLFYQRNTPGGSYSFQSIMNSGQHPQGYHMPSIYELTAAFPYFKLRLRDNWNDKDKTDMSGKLLSFDEKTANGNPKPYYGLEYLRLFGDEYDESNFINFNSIYKRVRNNGRDVIYAIRFIYNSSKNNNKAKATEVGNRYRCAYRYVISADGMNDDGKGHRLSVTARWLGNVPISIEDVATETFWEYNRSMDVIRIFNVENNSNQDVLETFLTRTKICPNTNKHFGVDNDTYGKEDWAGSFYRRAFTKNGFERKWNIGSNDQGAVRCIADWNLDENAANAPRKQKIKGRDEKYYEFSPK
ncbi:hypothetical protein [Hoylesella timonensis]|uniref:Lipoprotein n=1 Tax=Hoylesella timonensis CRIS 5C-B1 TaxID=679189 RepID=D1VYT6_9BACT|nr:hypothetical protein [Hoylesella timonensis]EFA97615.1 hypothetical protein HMPREF9019_1377 [Hoylesella timonensis CRIS 5C-B1]